MNLLIVNDIVMEANTMASGIPWEKSGIDRVHTAYSAGAAREIIRGNPIDILLCDIEMPDENGLSLIRWIKENGYDIECILLTCHADFAYAQEGISLGVEDYITLPAKYDDIAASVQKVCLRHQKHQEDAMEDDWRVGAISAYLERFPPGFKVCAIQIYKECVNIDGGNPKIQESRAIGQIMNKMNGWKKCSTYRTDKYGKQKGWIKTENSEVQSIDELPF